MKDFINVRFLSIQETAGHASHTYKSTIAVTFLTEILGMSFREYLMMSQKMDVPVYPLNEILNNRVNLPVEHPLPLFKKYLQAGYYPFYEEPGYDQRLQNALNQTLEVDIPVFAGMNVSTARKLKQLLYIVAQSVPFKPNINKIAGMINVHRNQINDYFHYMEKVVSSLRGRSPKQSGERDVVIRLLQPSASQ